MSSTKEFIDDLYKLCANQQSYPGVIQIATKATQGQVLDPMTIQQISATFDSVLPPKVQQQSQFGLQQPMMNGMPPQQMGAPSLGAPQIGGFNMGAPAMGAPPSMAVGATGAKASKFYCAQEFQQMVQTGQSTGQYYCHKQLGATSSRPGSYCCNAVKTFDGTKSAFEQVCSQHNRAKGGSKGKTVGFGSVEGAMAGFLNNFGAPAIGGVQQPPQFNQMGGIPGMGALGAPQFNQMGQTPGAPQMQQPPLGGLQNPSIQQSSFNPMGAPSGIQQPHQINQMGQPPGAPQFNQMGQPPGAPQFNPMGQPPGAPQMQQPPLGASSIPQFNPMGQAPGAPQFQQAPNQAPTQQFNPMGQAPTQVPQQQFQQVPTQTASSVPQFNPMGQAPGAPQFQQAHTQVPQQQFQQVPTQTASSVPQFNPIGQAPGAPQFQQAPTQAAPQFNPMGQAPTQTASSVPQFNPMGQAPGVSQFQQDPAQTTPQFQPQVAQSAATAFVIPSSTSVPMQPPNGMTQPVPSMNSLSQQPTGNSQPIQNVPGQTPINNGIPMPPASIVPSSAMPSSLLQHQKKDEDPSQLTNQFSQMSFTPSSAPQLQTHVAPPVTTPQFQVPQFQQPVAPVDAPQFQQPVASAATPQLQQPVTQPAQTGVFMRKFGDQEMYFNDDEGARGIVFIINNGQMYAINSIDVNVTRSAEPLPPQFTSYLKTSFTPFQESWLKSHGIQYNSVVPSLIEGEEVRADDEVELQHPDGSTVGETANV